MSDEATQAVITELSGHVIGLEMQRVSAIEELTPAEQDEPNGERSVDLARLWRLTAAPGEGARKAVTVDASGGRFRLAIGTKAKVRAIASDALLPLPAFLEPLGRRAAISALFITEGRLGLMVDLDALGSGEEGA